MSDIVGIAEIHESDATKIHEVTTTDLTPEQSITPALSATYSENAGKYQIKTAYEKYVTISTFDTDRE